MTTAINTLSHKMQRAAAGTLIDMALGYAAKDRQKAYLQIQEDARLVMKAVDEYAGVLPFDDRVSPEIISRELGLSKAAFKRAVGHLLRENRIELKNGKIFRR